MVFLGYRRSDTVGEAVQKLSQLRRSVITQLDFLGRECGSRAFGEWICGTKGLIEHPKGRSNLEVMRSAPAASRLPLDS
jgi:hypothetical protein